MRPKDLNQGRDQFSAEGLRAFPYTNFKRNQDSTNQKFGPTHLIREGHTARNDANHILERDLSKMWKLEVGALES